MKNESNSIKTVIVYICTREINISNSSYNKSVAELI